MARRLPTTMTRRRWLVPGAIGSGFVALVVIGLALVYPRVGAYMIRHKIGGKVAHKLGRDLSFGPVDVSLGHAVLHDVDIRGPLDGDTPLVHVDTIDVEFDAWKSIFGSPELGAVAIDGVVVSVRRDADGRDNVRDLIDRLRDTAGTGGGEGAGGDAKPSARPTRITVDHVRLVANDELTGTTALVGDGDATWTPDELVAHARNVTATTTAAPKATVASIEIHRAPGAAPRVAVEGGQLELLPELVLSGIAGQVVANPDHAGQYVIDLAGGYGGAGGKLWTAKGDLDPRAITASIELEAAKFQLDRLAPILAHSAIVDYASTALDTQVHLDVDRAGVKFAGGFHLTGLNVGHPLIADKEVRGLDLAGQIAGSFDRASKKLELVRGDFVTRNMPFSITGAVIAATHPLDESAYVPIGQAFHDKKGPRRGPHDLESVSLRLVIPPIDCQSALLAIPTEMAPFFAGYRMKGVFQADLHVAIDWQDLDKTELGGDIGINHCRVVDEPADSPKRLKDEFEQFVETDKGEWQSFIVGPTNPDFVPLDQISPYLISSIMSSEDYGFYKHHGFIPSEFKSALVNNLKSGGFVQGASSITMQMVKNVLLFREKTLARKLQELFLTWHVENTLEKDRILEIYLNVIEYGPGLYGIGPAAHEYFGKAAKDLNPVEAAFFSSILPDPKGRYAQYCRNELTKWSEGKIERQLGKMLERKQLTQDEYDHALQTPLLFVKDGSETEEDCLKRVKKAIKNARSTNPLVEQEREREEATKTGTKRKPKPEREHRKR
ncbi:MAG TPA: transglycosylase domain-containing protein [Kofleriaceae bacterium]|nr:transglycosylase domain-containing protein [Kofleriaceae bacterium]